MADDTNTITIPLPPFLTVHDLKEISASLIHANIKYEIVNILEDDMSLIITTDDNWGLDKAINIGMMIGAIIAKHK